MAKQRKTNQKNNAESKVDTIKVSQKSQDVEKIAANSTSENPDNVTKKTSSKKPNKRDMMKKSSEEVNLHVKNDSRSEELLEARLEAVENKPIKLRNELYETEAEMKISLGDIINSIWKKRRLIVVLLIVLLAILYGNRVLQQRNAEVLLGRDFSSANLDRVERGIYQLRVEMFGERGDTIREDTFLDFDRELNITFREFRGLIMFEIENMAEDIIINEVIIAGRLGNRDREDRDFFHIRAANSGLSLEFGENSRGVPIPLFASTGSRGRNDNVSRNLNSTELEEFRNYFELDSVRVRFWKNGEEINLRYRPQDDTYTREFW